MSYPTFSEVFFAHRDLVSDKWLNYLDIYEQCLRKYIGKQVSTLEIGVQNGGSIQVMNKYLVNAEVHGVDIDPAVLSLGLEKEAQLYCFDASDPVEIQKHLSGKEFKVIIDDGSHRNRDMIRSFRALFPKLQPGGVYIMEDVQTSYWGGDFGGGLNNPDSVIQFFKKLIDLVNFFHVKEELSYQDYFGEDRDLYVSEIESIQFYDNMIVINKLQKAKTTSYARFLTGEPKRIQAIDNIILNGYKVDYNKS